MGKTFLLNGKKLHIYVEKYILWKMVSIRERCIPLTHCLNNTGLKSSLFQHLNVSFRQACIAQKKI